MNRSITHPNAQLEPGAPPYPPILGAHGQQRALGEGAEGNALAVLAVDGLGFLLKHRGGVLKQREAALKRSREGLEHFSSTQEMANNRELEINKIFLKIGRSAYLHPTDF